MFQGYVGKVLEFKNQQPGDSSRHLFIPYLLVVTIVGGHDSSPLISGRVKSPGMDLNNEVKTSLKVTPSGDQ